MNEPLERRDDWRKGVDENLASLNAGQRVWEREIVNLFRMLGEADKLLRGDPEKDTDGLVARLHNIENSVALLKAVVQKDAAGGKGLIGRVEALESGERTSEHKWKFATAIVVAIVSFVGLLITNWGKMSAYLNKKSTDPVSQKIERAKHPRVRHVKERIVFEDPEE